jgi:ABC-2 type transport system permease protein
LKKKLFTVWVFARLNTKRFFRDRLALFFGILFPVIFLFIFGGINSGDNNVSFNVAVINHSHSAFATQFEKGLKDSKTFKVKDNITTFAQAQQKMQQSQIDGTIVLPADFGAQKAGQPNPSGQAQVYYTRNNEQAGQTLVTVLNGSLKSVNAKYVQTGEPFVAQGKPIDNRSLRAFDYAFAGLLGFAIIGLGIFGPINVFPELKKQGILRRLHTTPIRVWQYFLATAVSQAIIGLVSLGVMFAVALTVFHLKVVGNYIEIILFIILSVVMILGIGLAIGGWAKNERQAAPLSNIVVFPMMFLSGTFFPRFLMPEWLQGLTAYLPLTPVIDGLRLLVTEGRHLWEIGPQIGLIFAWMFVVYFIAFRVFRWE